MKHKQSQLLMLLHKYETYFSLGHWNAKPVNLEFQQDAIPYLAQPFPIPHLHEETMHNEIECLCRLGVLEKCYDSEWGAPTFIIPKKNGTVISDFQQLNKQLKCKPFPISLFQYAVLLDLNLGYYHIELIWEHKRCAEFSYLGVRIATNNYPWGWQVPLIFFKKMLDLMSKLEFVCAYLDNILVLITSTWKEHLHKLDKKVLHHKAYASLKVHAAKLSFGMTKIEYLGFWITHHCIKPCLKKLSLYMLLPLQLHKEK